MESRLGTPVVTPCHSRDSDPGSGNSSPLSLCMSDVEEPPTVNPAFAATNSAASFHSRATTKPKRPKTQLPKKPARKKKAAASSKSVTKAPQAQKRRPEVVEASGTSLSCPVAEAEGTENVAKKKKRKLPDLIADGIDPCRLEESVEQVKERFARGCECSEESCFRHINPEFVYRHRLNTAELTKAEHDMYLMGVTMASLSNPEETSRHRERKRLRTQYVFQGRRVCLDAFLYLENVSHYHLKRIRKHVITHGVTPRVHGNCGKKPPNTYSLDIYQHAAAFLQQYLQKYAPPPASSVANVTSTSLAKTKNVTIYLPPDLTRKKVHAAYQQCCEESQLPEIDKVMGYTTFRRLIRDQFPFVKFTENKIGTAIHHIHHHVQHPASAESSVTAIKATASGAGSKRQRQQALNS